MEPVRNIDLRLSAQIAALELLVVSLVQRSPELRRIVATSHDLESELQALAQPSLPNQPEVSDMMTSELQEAWRRLLKRVTDHG